MVGLPVRVLIDGAEIEPCGVALPLEITHGRSSVTTQPEPPETSITWLGEDCPWTLGDDLQVWSGLGTTPATYDSPTVNYDADNSVYDSDGTALVWRQRFGGTIAEITAESREGYVQGWVIDAVGYQARLGYTPIRLMRLPENDVVRVRAICTKAGVAVRVHGNPGGRLTDAEIDTDALSALHAACLSSGGLIWQSPDGALNYGTADHRVIDDQPHGIVPCEAITDGLSWTERVDDIVNEITVTWGPSTSLSESTFRHDASAAQPWGTRAMSVQTACWTETDAEQLGLLILARRAWPYWLQSQGIVAVDGLDPSDARMLNEVDVSTPVYVPIPINPAPTPADPAAVVIEGWVETWTETGEHMAQVAFSDQKRWVLTRLRTYAEVRDGGTYAFWANGTYLDMLTVEA